MNATATKETTATEPARQLSIQMQLDVPEAFAGKLFAYVAVDKPEGFGLGVAVANERGYSPINMFHYQANTCEEAEAEALRLNEARGITEDAALDIVLSSMRKGDAS